MKSSKSLWKSTEKRGSYHSWVWISIWIFLAQNSSQKQNQPVPFTTNQIPNKTYNNGFRAKTSVIENQGDEIAPPRAQKYNKFLGQQIRIEINQQKVEQDELSTNPIESGNLLFYDFNAGARHFNFGQGNNMRLSTRDDFRRTGMVGAKFTDQNKIDKVEIDQIQAKRRPITSHYRGGDRLPSRATKTRNKSKRICIGGKNKSKKREQQGSTKKSPYVHDSVSPKHARMQDGPVSCCSILPYWLLK
jgi:hypothetical protein